MILHSCEQPYGGAIWCNIWNVCSINYPSLIGVNSWNTWKQILQQLFLDSISIFNDSIFGFLVVVWANYLGGLWID